MAIITQDYGSVGGTDISKIYDESNIFASGSWVDTGIKPTASFTFIYAWGTDGVTFGSWVYDKSTDQISAVYGISRVACQIGSNNTIEVKSTQTAYPILHVQIYG